MHKELALVSEFMYSAGQQVRTVPHYDQEIIHRRFSWLMEELGETYDSKDLSAMADGIGDMLYVALGAALELGLRPHSPFTSLASYLLKVEQIMRLKGHEINYQPLVLRNRLRCEQYKVRLTRSMSRFPEQTKPELLTTSIELIIEACCEFGLYLGLPLSEVFAEIHDSNMSKFIDGHMENGKWQKGPSFRPPSLDHIIFPQS